MQEPTLLEEVRSLRDIVSRTQSPTMNHFWPVTLSWGIVVTIGYLACALLGAEGKFAAIPWIMPALVFLVGWPLHWHFTRRVRASAEERGVRPRYRSDLRWCWMSIYAMGVLWTAGLIVSGLAASHGYLLIFAWCSLLFVGYVINGVLLSKEWLWAAGVLLASLIAALLAGFLTGQTSLYWLPGYWIPGTFVIAGLLGRRNARRQAVRA